MSFTKHSAIKAIMVLMIAIMGLTEAFAQNIPPVQVNPDSNATCQPLELTFRWDTALNATRYQLQVSSHSNFSSSDMCDVQLSPTTTTYSVTVPSMNTYYYWRISTTYTGGGTTMTPIHPFKTIGVSPNPTSPVNYAVCVSKTPTIGWDATAGATGYTLEVYNSTTFNTSTRVSRNAGITSTTFTVSVPNNFKNYYWRISASYTNCESNWSVVSQFSTKEATPTGVSPLNNALGVDLTPTLQWSAVVPTDSYELMVSRSQNFSTGILYNLTGLTTTTFTINLPKNDTLYYWKVRALYLACYSDWSPTYKFKTKYMPVTLTSPSNARVCLPITYKYEWAEIATVQSYRLQIATDAAFTHIVVNQNSIMDLYFDATVPEGLTTYYWRVRAEDANNTGDWSNVRNFASTVNNPDLLVPANNIGGVKLVSTFQWSSTAPSATYHFQLSKHSNFSDTLINLPNLASSTYTVTLPDNNTDYYWRVSSTFSQCVGVYSDISKFRSVIKPPVLTLPGNNAVKQSLNIVFTWNAVPDAATYIINLSLTPNFAQLYYGSAGMTQTNHLVGDLTPNTKFYWRVAAVNADGTSEFSDVWSFTTSPRGPEVPTLVSPAFGAEKIPVALTLRWNISPRALKYHLQFSDSASFSQRIVDKDTLRSTSFDVSGLKNNNMYYWRVSAINDSGETQFSKMGSFRTIMLAPNDKAQPISPANDTTNQSIDKVKLIWLPVQRATEYEIMVATDAIFTNVIAHDSAIYREEYYLLKLKYDMSYYWKVKGFNEGGKAPWSDTYKFTTLHDVGVDDATANSFKLSASPNPFNSTTNVSFVVPNDGNVVVKVTNLLGEEVMTLADKYMSAGSYNIPWSALNNESGVYICTVKIGNNIASKQLILIK